MEAILWGCDTHQNAHFAWAYPCQGRGALMASGGGVQPRVRAQPRGYVANAVVGALFCYQKMAWNELDPASPVNLLCILSPI